MARPYGFSWIDEPRLAGLARPDSVDELRWLRSQGIDVIVSLTELPLRRDWVNDAGLMAVHVPIYDMTPPTQDQFRQCIDTIRKAHEQNRGVAVHCLAGMGRTGSILAGWLVSQGASAEDAIARIRQLRPGSIETLAQEEAIERFARIR
jgi:atypical dual specificity phosphatase